MIRLALLLAPLAAAAGAPSAPIQVDGFSISADQITREASAARARGAGFDAGRFVDRLVNDALLAAAARRSGLERDASARAWLDQASAKVLADALVTTRLSAATTVGEAELKAMYHQGGDGIRLQLVVVATRAEAEAVRARLDAGGELALEAARSLDRSAKNKGDTGLVNRVQLPPGLADAAFAAPIGQLIGPVEMQLGFAVARVVERKIADEAGFAAKRPQLEAYARQRGADFAKKHLAEKLRAKHGATVDTKFLESLGQRMDASPAELDRTVATVGEERIPYRVLLPRVRALAGSQAGHLSGAGVKGQLAWALVDERLLALAAREAGLQKDARVASSLALAELHVLAALEADRVRLAQPAGASAKDREEAVSRRLEELRKGQSITVDRKAALAAASAQG